MIKKMLSHRLRSYDICEHSKQGLLSACSGSARYLEIDIRASRDGIQYMYHDPIIKASGQRVFLNQTHSKHCDEFTISPNRKLMRLEEVLHIFKTNSKPPQILCLDIKDAGFERDIFQLVSKHGLEERVYYISWCPQVLTKLYQLGIRSPLFLSHWNLMRFGFLGKMLLSLMKNRILRLSHFIMMGTDTYQDELKYSHGYQHCYLCNEFPDFLCDVLKKSGGGLSVHTSQINSKLLQYCREQDLQLWTFSVNSISQFKKYAKIEGVDVVFCDDAPLVLQQLNGGQ